MISIGFDATAKGGPGIFLSRLQTALEELGAFSASRPDVWLQLSHKPTPEWLRAGRPACKLLVRTAGGYYYRHYLIRQPDIFPIPVLDDWYSRRKNEAFNRPIRENLVQADGIVFQSEFTRRMVQRFIASTPPGAVILNGVDTRRFTPEPSVLQGRRKRGLDILVSHQFRLHKRLHDVIRTVARLKRLRPDREPIRLHVVGGDSRNAFQVARNVIAEEGLSEQVHFWGAQLPEALPQFYRRCDFMLALPLWDPCPNAVVEALSCGLPVVATDAGGIPEIIGEAGRIVPEPLPLTYADHEHDEHLPRAPVRLAAEEASKLLERLEDYRALARERAVSALDIREIARQYLEAAEQLGT